MLQPIGRSGQVRVGSKGEGNAIPTPETQKREARSDLLQLRKHLLQSYEAAID
jgi:hypothetical protein